MGPRTQGGEPADAVPWNYFVIYEGDEPFVSVELVHRQETVTDPRQVDLYRRLYDQMWQRLLPARMLWL